MPLINCKLNLKLTWNKNCVICSLNGAGNNAVEITITKTEFHVPIVTLSTKDSAKLSKLLNDGFKRSVYWSKYKKVHKTEAAADPTYRYQLDLVYEGVNRLFVLTSNNVAVVNRVLRDGYRKYFIPRDVIGSYNVIIDSRNFYDQPINDPIRKYDEVRKIATGKRDNYATGCLLDYEYFLNNYQLIAIDLSKQKELDADPRAIQQIEFIGNLPNAANVVFLLEQ